nr:hypothetical protein BaRGS_013744 [Batillaria attramentaria]
MLGHLHLLETDPRAKFREWRRQYGDVFSFYMGGRLVVVLNGYDVIKQALVKQADAFSDRLHFLTVHLMTDARGVADTSGPLWKAQRKTCLEILREFGMGKNVLALKVQEEVDEYVNAIASKHSQPFDMTRMTQISISNNICSIVFGKRFDYQDPVFLDYVRAVDEYLSTSSANNPGVIFPNLRFIPGDPFKVHKRLQDFRMLLSKFIQPAIDRHVQEFDEDCVDDFISAYIRQLGEHRTRETHDYINEKNLPKVVLDLFGAGTETTSNAIRWTVAYFLHHPHVQDKCYQEIVNVIGTDRKPEMTDRQEMTYLEATIMEVLRIADIVPMSLPHSTSCDVTLAGYTIPKDAFIMPNLDSVLQDPEVWGDPDKFRPDRFIGPDGKIIRPDEFIPFSVGRRVCLGESLARMELFLYLTTMIQHFRFLPPEDDQLPSLEGIMGMTYSPKRFLVRAVPSFYMAGRLVVVLNGYDVIKQALVKQADTFSDRPHFLLLELMTDARGVADASGPLWKAQRKTCLEILREFGMGKNVLALKVQEEVDEYVNAIASKHGQPFDMTRMTQISVSNNICSIVFGKRFDYQDPVFLDYVRVLDENLSTNSSSNPGVIFPNLRFIPGDPFKVHKRLQDFRMLISKFIQPAIDRHVQEFDEDCVDDFISAYIRQIGEHRTRETHDYINEKNLPKVVLDLFGAGTETTSNAIRWTVAYFLHHPHVQDKCYQEIVNVIGTDRKPEMTDRQEMTYLEATIMEVLRIADIVPMSLPHATSCDVTLAGYTVPKDAFIMPNLDSVLQDPEVWGDPDKFRPDRFIGHDGKIIRPDEFIPFSVGRRVCLGESLARMELFLYLTTMIQHFRFLPPENDQLPSLEGILGLTYSPKRFLVRAVPSRQQT